MARYTCRIILLCILIPTMILVVGDTLSLGVQAGGAPGLRVQVFSVTAGRNLAHPALSGRFVVWMRYSNSTSHGDIYGKDLVTGRMFAVTVGGTVLYGPSISGTVVVWSACSACTTTRGVMGYFTYHNVDLYAEDLRSRHVMHVARIGSTFPATPLISNGRFVVWHEIRQGLTVTYTKDLVSGRRFRITYPTECRGPRTSLRFTAVVWATAGPVRPLLCGLNGRTGQTFPLPIARRLVGAAHDATFADDIVAWTDWDSNRPPQPATIKAVDLATGQEYHVTTLPYGRFNPQLGPQPVVSNRLIVWEAAPSAPFTGANTALYGFSISTGWTVRITAGPVLQHSAAVSDDIVVWQGLGKGQGDITGARIIGAQ